MSTKIYDGLIAVRKHPFTIQAQIKAVLEPHFLAKFRAASDHAEKHVGESWEEVFPGMFSTASPSAAEAAKPIPEGKRARDTQLYKLVELLYKTPTHTFTNLDFGYEAVLLPNGRGLVHSPLVLVFSERGGDDYRKALIDAGVVKEYGYWDNTDPEDGVSETEWDEREKAWSKLDVPRQDGLFISQPSNFETVWRR